MKHVGEFVANFPNVDYEAFSGSFGNDEFIYIWDESTNSCKSENLRIFTSFCIYLRDFGFFKTYILYLDLLIDFQVLLFRLMAAL